MICHISDDIFEIVHTKQLVWTALCLEIRPDWQAGRTGGQAGRQAGRQADEEQADRSSIRHWPAREMTPPCSDG